jgi:hypothetical protein
MDVTESLEADWIQIRTILKAQLKRFDEGQKVVIPGFDTETLTAEARGHAHRWITECEKIILTYATKNR